MTFKELGLKEDLLRGIEKLGYENPTPIQEKAIPAVISGMTDMVGLAQTGTGKTAAFGLPLLNLVHLAERTTQGIVICPTRELCLQITKDLKNFSSEMKGMHVVPVYGGARIDLQIKDLKKGAHIIVATPGRLMDLLKRKAVKLDHIEYVVLDEADEMFNMGFKEDIEAILEYTPPTKFTWLFSATMPKPVARIASTFMSDPVEVTVGSKNSSASTITHQYHLIHDKNRYLALKRVMDFNPDIYGIVFCQTRSQTRDVADRLIKDGYNADALHGDLSQDQRDYVMRKFRSKSLQVLVATDVAARGIDVDSITHVIHFRLPDDVENYTHRSGRTGRAGREGNSVALVCKPEFYRIKEIEKIIQKEIELHKLPTGQQVCEKQLEKLISNIKETKVNDKFIEPFEETLLEAFDEVDKVDLVKKFVSVEFNRFLQFYNSTGDLDVDPADIRKRGERNSNGGRRPNDEGFKRIFLNVGSKQLNGKGDLINLICKTSDITGKSIGRIDLKDTFSFFQVEEDLAGGVISSLTNSELKGLRLRAEESMDKDTGRSGGRSGGGSRSGGRGRGGKSFSSGGGSKSKFNRRGDRHH